MKDARKFLGLVLLGSLLWALGCSTGTVAQGTATPTQAGQEEQDPNFWRDWASSRGIGP
jgi:hypothetical protein